MIGQLVGHYKVVRKIGDGGMGSVFEALHESIGRRVAIKVLKNEYSRDQNLVTRFFNEARAVNIVSHPGIVGSFDYGQLPDGTAYIVMEFLEGESLAARLKRMRGAFGLDSLRIGRQIAAAISAAHNRGIIHRDRWQKSIRHLRSKRKTVQRRRSSHADSHCPHLSHLFASGLSR